MKDIKKLSQRIVLKSFMFIRDPNLEIKTNKEVEDGSIYHGQYKSHYKHGYGILIKANGDKYDGYWHNN